MATLSPNIAGLRSTGQQEGTELRDGAGMRQGLLAEIQIHRTIRKFLIDQFAGALR